MSTEQTYPSDENGDVLRQMAEDGIDLQSPRLMDFEHQFPDEQSAEGFRVAIAGEGVEATVRPPDAEYGTGWQVTCHQRMVPTHRAITDAELRFGAVAERFGGRPDGWGSMSNADGSPSE